MFGQTFWKQQNTGENDEKETTYPGWIGEFAPSSNPANCNGL